MTFHVDDTARAIAYHLQPALVSAMVVLSYAARKRRQVRIPG
jgi:hypothetical protein